MSLQGVKNIVPTANPKSGVTRSYLEVVESGIDRNNPSPESTLAIKAALSIQGDAVGTTNTQTLTNKTFPEPTSDSSPATKNYVDDKYSQTRYTHSQSTSENPWAITHNLGYYPDVTIMQSVSGGGSDDYEEVEVHVQHNSVNDLTINLSGVATGLALMR